MAKRTSNWFLQHIKTNTKFILKFGNTTIGRATGCDVTIQGKDISRKHCTLEILENDIVKIADLCTPNGTFINKQMIDKNQKISLLPQDIVGLGSMETFQLMKVKFNTDNVTICDSDSESEEKVDTKKINAKMEPNTVILDSSDDDDDDDHDPGPSNCQNRMNDLNSGPSNCQNRINDLNTHAKTEEQSTSHYTHCNNQMKMEQEQSQITNFKNESDDDDDDDNSTIDFDTTIVNSINQLPTLASHENHHNEIEQKPKIEKMISDDCDSGNSTDNHNDDGDSDDDADADEACDDNENVEEEEEPNEERSECPDEPMEHQTHHQTHPDLLKFNTLPRQALFIEAQPLLKRGRGRVPDDKNIKKPLSQKKSISKRKTKDEILQDRKNKLKELAAARKKAEPDLDVRVLNRPKAKVTQNNRGSFLTEAPPPPPPLPNSITRKKELPLTSICSILRKKNSTNNGELLPKRKMLFDSFGNKIDNETLSPGHSDNNGEIEYSTGKKPKQRVSHTIKSVNH